MKKRKRFDPAVAAVTRALIPLRVGMRVKVIPKYRRWAKEWHDYLRRAPFYGVIDDEIVDRRSRYILIYSKSGGVLLWAHIDDVYPL